MREINVNKIIDEGVLNNSHRWILFWCFIVMLFEGYDIVVIGTVIPVIMEEWQLSPVVAGALSSYLILGMVLGTLLIPPIADKYGRVKITSIGMLIFSGCMLGAAASTGPTEFGIYRFLSGLGIGAVMPNLIASVSDYSPLKQRNRMITIQQSGYSVGGMIAAGLSIYFISQYGWRPMLFFGALPIFIVPFLHKLIPESPSYYMSRKKYGELGAILQKMNQDYKPMEGDKLEILHTKAAKIPIVKLFQENRTLSTLMIWLTYFISLFLVYGMSTWLPKLMRGVGYDMGSSLMTLMMLSMGGVMGAYLGGLVSDKWRPRKALMTMFFIASLVIVSLSFRMDTLLLNFAVLLAGICTLGTQYTLNAYVSQFYPQDMRSTAVGWGLGMGRIGGTLSPTILGWLLAMQAPFYMNFVFFSVLALIAIIALALVQEKYSAQKQREKA